MYSVYVYSDGIVEQLCGRLVEWNGKNGKSRQVVEVSAKNSLNKNENQLLENGEHLLTFKLIGIEWNLNVDRRYKWIYQMVEV